MRGIKELGQLNSPEQESSDDVSNSEAIGASATEEINFKNNGTVWTKKGEPIEVNSHDFGDKDTPIACPYGVQDVGKNKGFVNVGISADTGEFATASIKKWWELRGKKMYSDKKEIYICADVGGSDVGGSKGYRLRLWKSELQKWGMSFFSVDFGSPPCRN